MKESSQTSTPKPSHLVGKGINQEAFSPGARRWEVVIDQEGVAAREPDQIWVDEAAERGGRSGKALAKISSCMLLVVAAVVVTVAYWKGGGGGSAGASPIEGYDRSAEAVIAFAEAFCAEADPRKRLAMSCDGGGVEARMADYPESALSAEAISVEFLERLHDPPRTAFIASFEEGSQRFLVVVETDEGLRVDWDAYANYGAAEWHSVAAGELVSAEVRVVCHEDDFYAGDFSDDSQWHCYRLSLPGHETSVFAYASRKSLRDRYLTAKLSQSSIAERGLRAYLLLRRSGEIVGRPLYEIERVLALGWILPGSDLEQRWQDEADIGVLPPAFDEAARRKAAFPGLNDVSPEALFPELGETEN